MVEWDRRASDQLMVKANRAIGYLSGGQWPEKALLQDIAATIDLVLKNYAALEAENARLHALIVEARSAIILLRSELDTPKANAMSARFHALDRRFADALIARAARKDTADEAQSGDSQSEYARLLRAAVSKVWRPEDTADD